MLLRLRSQTPILARVQFRCQLLNESLHRREREKIHGNRRVTIELVTLYAYKEHVEFLEALALTPNSVDKELSDAAVCSVCRSIEAISRWDQGRHARAEWQRLKLDLIASFGFQRKQSWAAECRHSKIEKAKLTKGQMYEDMLPERADYYFEQVLAHVMHV